MIPIDSLFYAVLVCLVSVFNAGKFATLDTMHALCLPLGASISLLVMFFFFDSMQMLFAVCTASKWNVESDRRLANLYSNHFCHSSNRNSGLSLPPVADVSIHNSSMFRW